MPTPNKGESEKDFVERCIPVVLGEGTAKDGAQAAAICHSMYRESKENMKLETMDINKPVQVCEVGKWKGKDYTEADFDEAIKNYTDGVAEPYITLDHNPGLTKATQDFLKATSLGFVSKLWRDGKKLYANFKQVPKLIGELIDAGALKQRSIEYWNKFKSANGKIYNNVLEAVTFHGANGLPAVNTLEDIPKLFKEAGVEGHDIKSTEGENAERVEIPVEFNDKEANNMADITVEKKEYESLISLKNDYAELKNQITEKEAEIEQLKKDAEVFKKEKIELEKMKAEMDKEKAENLKKEAEGFVDTIVAEKKLKPAYRDMKVKEYIALKAGDEKDFELFKKELADREKITVENITKDGEPEVDNSPVAFKAGAEADFYAEHQKKVESIMKRDKVDFQTALARLRGEEVKK